MMMIHRNRAGARGTLPADGIRRSPVQQLNQQDAVFLYSEKPRAPMHLSSFHIYNPATAPGGAISFEQFVAHVRSRLPLARVLRRKLVRVPLDLDYPYWVEDEGFDLEFHVRHVALPAPGGWRELWNLAARLHSQPLDLDRPPWELYLIDGLDAVEGYAPGSFAMQIKIHHSAIDGIAGIELMNALHDLDRGGRGTIVDPWRGEADPPALSLLALAAANTARVPRRALEIFTRSVSALFPWRGGRGVAGPVAAMLPRDRPPRTKLNQPVTNNRVGDAIILDLAETKQVKAAVPGATVNDVLLALVGGGLRRYLRATGDLPDAPLMAGVPISMRTEADAGTPGNKISMMIVSLATDVDDARRRLEAVQRSTSASKEQSQAVEARVLADSAALFPGALLGLAVRANAAQGTEGITAQIGNVCVTNVPGSQVPLYLCGAQMEAYYSLGPVYDNAGPIHVIVSYLGKIYLSVTTCREIVPDIEHYADCLRASWDELRVATVSPTAARPPRTRTRRARSDSSR
jgi:diacylglycerol O-acyltransferase / wax synthase